MPSSRIDIVEKKIKELEKRLNQLHIEVNETNKKFAKAVLVLNDVTEITAEYRYLVTISPMVDKNTYLGMFEGTLKEERRILEKYPEMPMLNEITRERLSRFMASLKIGQVTFDEFSERAVRGLGVSLAKSLVKLEDIIEVFGSEFATRWNELSI